MQFSEPRGEDGGYTLVSDVTVKGKVVGSVFCIAGIWLVDYRLKEYTGRDAMAGSFPQICQRVRQIMEIKK